MGSRANITARKLARCGWALPAAGPLVLSYMKLLWGCRGCEIDLFRHQTIQGHKGKLSSEGMEGPSPDLWQQIDFILNLEGACQTYKVW